MANSILPEALYVEPIPPNLREMAIQRLDSGDVLGFLISAGNHYSVELTVYNSQELQKRGLLEVAMVEAFTATRVNNRYWIPDLRFLFSLCDRSKLRAAADPLPGPGPYTIYRGVSGHGRARHIRGLSWTASLERAWWFARRVGLPDPAVFRTIVDEKAVLFYCNERNEQEFVVMLADDAKIQRVQDTNSANRKGVR